MVITICESPSTVYESIYKNITDFWNIIEERQTKRADLIHKHTKSTNLQEKNISVYQCLFLSIISWVHQKIMPTNQSPKHNQHRFLYVNEDVTPSNDKVLPFSKIE